MQVGGFERGRVGGKKELRGRELGRKVDGGHDVGGSLADLAVTHDKKVTPLTGELAYIA
jgi:hypothetical protein